MKREYLVKYRGNKSQAEMAKKYNVSQQAWSLWERGKNTPTVVIMKELEKDIGVPMDIIFFDVFNNKK